MGQKSWTPAQIEEAVAKGDSLVICDNLVLRTDGYEKIHPGGRFTIEKNFGRDIAKFYYGNYSLTNGKLSKSHTHGGQANSILMSMIVGVIDDQHDVVEMPTKIFAKHTFTDTIATFTFKSVNGKNIRNYKGWYQDLSMVAKHFTVSSQALPHIKRQYTICQTMEMHCLKALYKLAKDIIEGGPGSQIRLDESLFNGNDTNQISLTLKNYKRPNGVATQIFNVDLVNYQSSLLHENTVVATPFSSNNRASVMIVPHEEDNFGNRVVPAGVEAKSSGTQEPWNLNGIEASQFDSDKSLRRNPNVGFMKAASKKSNSSFDSSASPPKNSLGFSPSMPKHVSSKVLENVQEEDDHHSSQNDGDDPRDKDSLDFDALKVLISVNKEAEGSPDQNAINIRKLSEQLRNSKKRSVPAIQTKAPKITVSPFSKSPTDAAISDILEANSRANQP